MEIQNAAILVVDPNKATQQTMVQALTNKGFEVVIADDGQAALQILGGRAIDLVLLEAQMPGVRGADVLRAIRQNAAIETLPVIVLSSSKNDDDIIESFDLGANDVVNRPFEITILLARIQAQLRARKRQINKPKSNQSTASNPGIIIAGQYKVEERIGEGGFGAVFRAVRLSDKKIVAIKVLLTTVMPSQKALTRFQIEGITTRRVQHKNAVIIYDSGITLDGLAFLVMELLRGMPLDKEIKNGPLSAKRAAQIMIPVCEAVSFAHQAKIIHRDIKPSNIFLHREDGVETPKVLDFGLAKIVDESFGENFTREGHVLGTVSYVAPERLRTQPYDGSSDTYSLGATLYEMVVGAPPFTTPTPNPAAVAVMHLHDLPEPPKNKQPSLHDGLNSLILAMLEKNPAKRPALQEIVARLQPVADGPDIAPIFVPSPQAPAFGTMMLTEVAEENAAPVDALAKTQPQEAEMELGESSIMQAFEVAPPVKPATPPVPRPPATPPPTRPMPAKLPTPPIGASARPPSIAAPSEKQAEIELGESSIMQAFEVAPPIKPAIPPALKTSTEASAKPPMPKPPTPTAPATAAPKPMAALKPSPPNSLKLPSPALPKPGTLPPPKPLLKPPPPLAKPPDTEKKG